MSMFATRARRECLKILVAVVAITLLGASPAQADPPENISPPTILGSAQVGEKLRAHQGSWTGEVMSYRYRWFRDDVAIRGANRRSYRPVPADQRRQLTVRVYAVNAEGESSYAESDATGRVRRGTMTNRKRPRVIGTKRFGSTVWSARGRWSARPRRVRYQWIVAGRPIRGATAKRYRVRPSDVGRRVRVQVWVSAPGYRWSSRRSRPVTMRHRTDQRRTVTYSVTTRGDITTNVATFARQAAATYADPRGWRGGGVRFVRVKSGGDFDLVLANANQMTSFSSACSPEWSCRVGRYVIINQERWKGASPAWNAASRSRRDYRHMVVNHETGHWLGFGHAGCPRPGAAAPVMMQQSKGGQGCAFNPWPTLGELGHLS